jgi:uncharacterized GH25 family protein
MRSGVAVVLTVITVLLAGPAVAPAAAQSADPVTLTVSVTNQEGDPVAGAELTATWETGSATATTASNGKAFVDVERGANVTIELSHPDYIRNHPFVVRDATEREVAVPAYRRGQLSVVVADANGPVADARVVLRKNGRITSQAQTDGNGEFDSEPIEAGEYTVAVAKPEYLRNVTTVQVNGSSRTQVALERGTVLLTLSVRDPHFSPPRGVGNATVTVESVGQLRTLSSGETSVSVPVNTDLSVTVEKDGYEDATTQVRVNEADLRTNLSTTRTPSLRITSISTRVVAGERLSAEVVDEYGDPVEGATVLLDGEPAGTTDADGRATVTVEEPGEHTLAAETDGLDAAPTTIRAIPEDGTTSTPTPSPTSTPSSTEAAPGSGLSVPGFTPLTAAVGIVVALAVLAVRRR